MSTHFASNMGLTVIQVQSPPAALISFSDMWLLPPLCSCVKEKKYSYNVNIPWNCRSVAHLLIMTDKSLDKPFKAAFSCIQKLHTRAHCCCNAFRLATALNGCPHTAVLSPVRPSSAHTTSMAQWRHMSTVLPFSLLVLISSGYSPVRPSAASLNICLVFTCILALPLKCQRLKNHPSDSIR